MAKRSEGRRARGRLFRAAAPVAGSVGVLMQTALAAPPKYDHVVVVVEENHAFNQIIGDTTDAPYINSLVAPANGGVDFTNFFALYHPSQPNYLDMFSGSNQGVTTDNPIANTPFTTANLAASLRNAGATFTGYSEDLPGQGSLVDTSGNYARKHNPWSDWQATSPTGNELPGSMNQPFSAFPPSTNFASLPAVSFVVPNLADDMHDPNGTINGADNWLKTHIDAYNTWAKSHNSLLVVTWDEDNDTSVNQIPTIFSGAGLIAGSTATKYNHDNLLRTIEDMYGATPTGAAANVGDITGVFAAPSSTFTWDPAQNKSGSGGTGTWDASTTADWFNGTNDVTWQTATASTVASFGGTGGTVTVGTVSANNIAFNVAGYTLNGGTITMGGPAKITAPSGSTVINSAIAGASGLTIAGGGLTLGGANTFTGGLTITNSAFVNFATDSNLGGSGQPITIAGATLAYTGTTAPTISRSITIGTGGASLNTVNNAGTGKLVVTGVISGSGAINKTGPGWLTLYGANTTTGAWNVKAGVVEAGNATALGSGSVTLSSGGELGNNAPAAIANNLTLNAGSTIGADYPTAGSTGTFTGTVNVVGNSTVRLGNFWNSSSQNVTFSGNLSGSGNLATAAGAGASSSTGVLTLSGNNSAFSGGLTISTGTVATTPSATKPLGTGAINMNGGTLLVDGQVSASGAAGSIAAVTNVVGFNKDVILGNPDTGGTTTGTMDGSYSFYQTGFTPIGKSALTTGGISGTSQVSAITNTVNPAVHTPFTFQSFTANNTLSIAQNGTGTITLNAPTAYANLSVVATSTFGSSTDTNDVRNVTIHFADGSNVTTTYKAYDWSVGTDTTRSGSDIFGTTINRYSSTSTPNQDTRNFGMYESDIDLTNIGGVDYSFKPVQSLTFSAINDDAQGRSTTEIFGVSGAARGQASGGPVANYGNDVTVNANSTIDVGKDIQEAILGNLTIVGSSVLTVTSDNTTASQPYTLAFASSSTSSSLNFNIQRSKGNGIGTVVLDTSTGQSLSSNASVAGATPTYPSISVNGGALAFRPGGSPFNASSLTLSSTGTLNVTNNNLLIHQSGAAAEANLRALLASAYHNGSWDGAGLTSSFAGGSTELGYASIGTSADPAILVKLASVGDTNLDGSISTSDIDNVLANYDPLHIKPQNWRQGDFNYDGFTDNQDLNQLMALYNPNGNSTITTAEFDQLQAAEAAGVTGSAVPEPASLSLLAIGAGALLGRRSRRR